MKDVKMATESNQCFDKWIKSCMGCVDSRAATPEKNCIYCVRCPFSVSGDEKIDFHFSTLEEKDIATAKFKKERQEKREKRMKK